MSKYGHMINDIREIFKSSSPDQFFEGLLDHMDEVSKKYEGFLQTYKNPQEAMRCIFVGYLSTALMLSAMEQSGVSSDKKLFYIDTIVRIVETQLLKGATDETGKEAN